MSSSSDAVARRKRIAERAAAKRQLAAERLKAMDGIFKRFLAEQQWLDEASERAEAEAQRVLDEAAAAAAKIRAGVTDQIHDSELRQAELVRQFHQLNEPVEGIAEYLDVDAKRVRALLKVARARQVDASQPHLEPSDHGSVDFG